MKLHSIVALVEQEDESMYQSPAETQANTVIRLTSKLDIFDTQLRTLTDQRNHLCMRVQVKYNLNSWPVQDFQSAGTIAISPSLYMLQSLDHHRDDPLVDMMIKRAKISADLSKLRTDIRNIIKRTESKMAKDVQIAQRAASAQPSIQIPAQYVPANVVIGSTVLDNPYFKTLGARVKVHRRTPYAGDPAGFILRNLEDLRHFRRITDSLLRAGKQWKVVYGYYQYRMPSNTLTGYRMIYVSNDQRVVWADNNIYNPVMRLQTWQFAKLTHNEQDDFVNGKKVTP